MKIEIRPGKYIVAVSGGVDSVVLLDLLAAQPELDLVVAHYDHGIRTDSSKDRALVGELAQQYDLPFEYEEGRLGSHASEEKARKARYDFLQKICKKHHAQAVITAHHQDDVLETMILNLLRGTGRSGLSSLKSGHEIIRPLLLFSKNELYDYARAHNLIWQEDSTNTDQTYVRNWVRHSIIPKMSKSQRERMLQLHAKGSNVNQSIDQILENLRITLDQQRAINRKGFTALPHDVAKELLASWLRQNGIRDFDKKTLERLTAGLKTLEPGKVLDIKAHYYIQLDTETFVIKTRDSSQTKSRSV